MRLIGLSVDLLAAISEYGSCEAASRLCRTCSAARGIFGFGSASAARIWKVMPPNSEEYYKKARSIFLFGNGQLEWLGAVNPKLAHAFYRNDKAAFITYVILGGSDVKLNWVLEYFQPTSDLIQLGGRILDIIAIIRIVQHFGLGGPTLRERFQDTYNIWLLGDVVSKGLIDQMEWIMTYLWSSDTTMTARSLKVRQMMILKNACMAGQLAAAQWLTDNIGASFHVEEDRCSTRQARRTGCITSGTYACTCRETRAVHLRAWPVFAFRRACKGGDLGLARWLTISFGVNAEDVRGLNGFAMRMACKKGHLEVVRWLITRFGLGLDDIPSASFHRDGREITRWLIEWSRGRPVR